MKTYNALTIYVLTTLGKWDEEASAFIFPIQTKQHTLAPLYSSQKNYVREFAIENGFQTQESKSSNRPYKEKVRDLPFDSVGVHDLPNMNWGDSANQGGKLSRRTQDGVWGETSHGMQSNTYGQETGRGSHYHESPSTRARETPSIRWDDDSGTQWGKMSSTARDGIWDQKGTYGGNDRHGQDILKDNYGRNSMYGSYTQDAWHSNNRQDSWAQSQWHESSGQNSWHSNSEQGAWYMGSGHRRVGNHAQGYGQRRLDGGTLQTFSSSSPYSYGLDKDTHVTLSNNGRPINAEMMLWDGPDNAPQQVRTYCMDGSLNRFKATFSGKGTMSIRNTGSSGFPATATVNTSPAGTTSNLSRQHLRSSLPMQEQTSSSTPQEKTSLSSQGYQDGRSRVGSIEIQGCGALKTWPIVGGVRSATVELESEGRPISAIVELWQGPTNVQQVAQLFSQDGYDRPYSMEVDLMGSYYGSSTIAIRNVGPIEYPIIARVSY